MQAKEIAACRVLPRKDVPALTVGQAMPRIHGKY